MDAMLQNFQNYQEVGRNHTKHGQYCSIGLLPTHSAIGAPLCLLEERRHDVDLIFV